MKKRTNISTSNNTSKKDHSPVTKSISISNMGKNIFRYKRIKKIR